MPLPTDTCTYGACPNTCAVLLRVNAGRFVVARMCVILEDGREGTPTEFERIAGKATRKKWKKSICIDKVRAMYLLSQYEFGVLK